MNVRSERWRDTYVTSTHGLRTVNVSRQAVTDTGSPGRSVPVRSPSDSPCHHAAASSRLDRVSARPISPIMYATSDRLLSLGHHREPRKEDRDGGDQENQDHEPEIQ